MTILITILALTSIYGLYCLFKNLRDKSLIASSVLEIETISFDLSGSAQQVSSVSKDLYSASQEQLDNLNSTVSASHEINSMIMRTNDNAHELTMQSSTLEQMSSEGQRIVEHMVSSSQKIMDGSVHFKSQMTECISELTSALSVIKEIADKTKLINEIVFQTKLLSFNASVEAARAGEHGKGFAVVAEEIGKLAQVSGKSSVEISEIVEKSLTSVNNALTKTIQRVEDLTQQTAQLSQDGFSKSKECEHIFSNMTSKISEINSMIRDISTASKEQSLGVEQLDQAIINLQEVADRNRLVASQSTQHAQSFEQQTKNLLGLTNEIKFFLPKKHRHIIRMQKFEWNEKLELGVHEMDDEHKILVGYINELVVNLESQYENRDKESLIKAFSNLANYTIEHFSHEEAFMASINYPLFNSHKKIHEKLLEQVAQYGRDIQNDTLDDQKLVSFLRNWLISHIMGVDMQYAAHYKENH